MNVFVNVDAERILAKLRGAEGRLQANLQRVITRQSIELQGRVKERKLTGQVLHVRTGTLRRSINRRVEARGSDVVATVGTNVHYAHVHEYGFTGTVLVREHVRRSRAQMSLAKFRTNKLGERIEVKGSYRKAGGGTGEILVREHLRDMVMPERSFLRSSLREMEPEIRKGIREAVMESLK